MEIKKNPLSGGEENKKQAEVLKNKINGFLINYFNYLVLSLGIIILVAGLFVLIYPKYQQISKANEVAKNNLQIEYETKLSYLNSIRNLKKSYQSVGDEEKAKLVSMLPAGRDTSPIITEIESITVRNGAILTSIRIEPAAASGRANLKVDLKENKESLAGIFNELPQGVGQIKIEIRLGSINYPILKNIIKTFENNLRLFDISEINFNASENEAILNIYSYYLSR
ncbi:MAG: hypothetical protein Q8O59_02435 [bacterium]|nr:hypothetical protein [bacterium]